MSAVRAVRTPPPEPPPPPKSVLTSPVALAIIAAATLVLMTAAGILALRFAGGMKPVPADEPPPALTPMDTDGPIRAPVTSGTPADEPWLPAEKQKKVNAAIDKGVAWIRKRMDAEGGRWPTSHPLGNAALTGLVLLETGSSVLDPHVKKAAAVVRKLAPTDPFETYELSLAVLFLDRFGDPADGPLLKNVAARLVASQRADGGWSYPCPPRSPDRELRPLLDFLTSTRPPLAELTASREGSDEAARAADLSPLLRTSGIDRAREERKKLPDVLASVPSVHLALNDAAPTRLTNQGSDNSNTQFALLALWTASRHEVPVERALALATRRFRESQANGGTWGYHMQGPGSPAMTGVGLLSLAIGHGLRAKTPGEKPVRDDAIEKGLKALAGHVGGAGSDLYFLWTLERVAVLYGLRKIDGKDWYGWGSGLLTARQAADGHWAMGVYHGSSPVWDTNFALLFLRRANLTTDLTRQLKSTLSIQRAEP